MTVAVRFAPASELAVVMEELARASLASASFDGGAVEAGPALVTALGGALAFPASCGRSWDAGEECMRDLGERYRRGAALLIEHGSTLWQRLPRETGLMTALWLGASETGGIPLRLVFLLEPEP